MRRTVLGTGIDGGRDADGALPSALIDGRYQVESRIGRGGMGVVYRAEGTNDPLQNARRKQVALWMAKRAPMSPAKI